MKTTPLFFLFLLFVVSAEAQSLRTGLINTVETINCILEQKKRVGFTNQDYDVFYPTKIKANLQGQVFCVDGLTTYATKTNGIMFNVLKIESFVINGGEIKALDKNQETIVAIFQGSLNDSQALKKELKALRFICRLYSKEDPNFKCD